MLRIWLCTLSILCLTTIVTRAQVFPIQSQVNLVPPYSGNLSDYTFPGSQRITVSLTCNDITISNYRVKLRLTIEGLGITLRSKPNISFEPLILDGGSPLLLYGDDLAQYLDPRNLDFIGLSKTEYQRTGKLPEGVYRFHVEVLDYNRGTVVSNKGFATAWIMFNDVPMLNFPSTNSKIKIIDPTNIAFTWTPRHTGSPNAAFTTEYIFRLIEIWPSNRNPNDAFLTQSPLYEVETTRSQIVYGPGEPLLIPGRKYAWQVQARDTEGRDLFKNNGKSEVFIFQFGDAIEMPQNLRKETANATTISIRWETSPSGETPERFRIRYRPDGGSTWYEDVTTNYFHTLTGLANNKAYDIQVRAEAGRQVSDYTFNQRHSTTAVVADSTYQCGNPFNIQPPVMTTPLQHMNPGDIFKCADFDHVLVTEVVRLQAMPGGFRGKGFVRINGFNRANFAVEFTGTFNSESVLVTGSMKTISDPGNAMSNLIEEMKKIGEKPPVMDSTAANPDSNLIIISGLIDSVYFNSNGEIIVLEEGGSTQTFEHKKNAQGEKQEMIVKDDAGNTWTVDKDGNISKAEAAIAGVYSSRDSLNFVVNFRDNEAALYGFDPDNQFPTPSPVKVNNRDYFVRWKSVEQGKQDFVDAFVEGSSRFPEKVGLKIETQNVSTQPGTEPNTSKVIFPGAFDGDQQELLAYAKLKASGSSSEEEVILGKLNVVTYEFIQKKVIVVPVNAPTSLTGPQIQSRLNNIYGQAVAGWHVTVEDVFNIGLEFIEKLDEEESGNLASYNKKMREFNRAYKNSNPAFDKNAFYIFLIKGTGFRFNAFMPFKRGFGYVFVDELERAGKDPLWAIAHELGHGAFNLRHTFDEHSVVKGSTKNLMDYDGGEELKKFQWDYVHNPESMVGWLQDDEAGASVLCLGIFDDCDEVIEILNIIRGKRMQGRNLNILYPNDGDTVKSGWNFSYAGRGFKEVNIIYEGDTTGAVVDPLAFKEYSVSTNGEVRERGFVYEHENVKMRIQVMDAPTKLDQQIKVLKSYLYGIETPSQTSDTIFSLRLLHGENVVNEDTILLITAEPSMPDIRARVTGGSTDEYKLKLVIEYLRLCVAPGEGRSPNQTSTFPSAGWHEIKAGETWDIDFGVDAETNRPKIRGGIAYLIVANETETLDTIRFFIKGTNPTVDQVNAFVNQAPYNTLWFFKKIIFHESGTPNNLTAQARQFNVYNANNEDLAHDWNAFSRCPNLGPPCGWGLMQLDNPRPPAQALWDWKANITRAYALLQEKRNAVIANLNSAWTIINNPLNDSIVISNGVLDGGIDYVHRRSAHFTHNTDEHFGPIAVAPNRSLIEACWIKTYNGLQTGNGNQHYYFLTNGIRSDGVLPTWTISDFAVWYDAGGAIHYNHYVREIGEQQTPQ